MHIFVKFKMKTCQNRTGKDLKVKITGEIEPKKAFFCFAENFRVRRGSWVGGEVEVERGRLSYVAACRSLRRFLRGVQAGIETFLLLFFKDAAFRACWRPRFFSKTL